jgi:hypothetical protein
MKVIGSNLLANKLMAPSRVPPPKQKKKNSKNNSDMRAGGGHVGMGDGSERQTNGSGKKKKSGVGTDKVGPLNDNFFSQLHLAM